MSDDCNLFGFLDWMMMIRFTLKAARESIPFEFDIGNRDVVKCEIT